MFRKNLNRAVLRIRIETVTPLLIRAGTSGLHPAAADLTCVRTRHVRFGSTVYIPGSSLKGVVRSAAEAAVRGQDFGSAAGSKVLGACEDPLDHRDRSCGGRWYKREALSAEIHIGHCLACRTFGSLAIKGRASPRDLFPWSASGEKDHAPGGSNQQQANDLELRHGIGIDRLTGSVKAGALFEQELVPAGVCFWGDIALENYQVWQLGLLAEALSQINDGIAQLGSSKSRGLGVARVHVEHIVHEQRAGEAGPEGTARLEETERPCGVGDLSDKKQRHDYGLLPEKPLPAARGQRRGLAVRFEADEVAAKDWLEAGLAALGGLR
jgi:CRISPR-associated protein Csm3